MIKDHFNHKEKSRELRLLRREFNEIIQERNGWRMVVPESRWPNVMVYARVDRGRTALHTEINTRTASLVKG